jgi:serine/threonine-protein kinase ULK/ATG1
VVTEYCEGGDLHTFLKSRGSIPEVDALKVMMEVLEGFKALRFHKVLHRDLKLANILLKEGHIKIADFGFSKISEEAITVLGSPLNMAPEVLR